MFSLSLLVVHGIKGGEWSIPIIGQTCRDSAIYNRTHGKLSQTSATDLNKKLSSPKESDTKENYRTK